MFDVQVQLLYGSDGRGVGYGLGHGDVSLQTCKVVENLVSCVWFYFN